MLCKFDRLVYPKCSRPSDAEGYMVAIYRLCEELRDSRGNLLSHIKAVGYYLPVGAKQRFDLSDHWTKTKHGLQYEVEQYTEVITPSREGVIAYLSSGQIKGIGPKTAEKIYDTFGPETLDMLDREPEKLLRVPGISEKKLRKMNTFFAICHFLDITPQEFFEMDVKNPALRDELAKKIDRLSLQKQQILSALIDTL